jgi:hypothetical protein
MFDLLNLCFIAFPLFLTGQFRSLFSFQRTIFSTTLHILSRYRIQCQALFFINFNFYQSMMLSFSSQPLVSLGRN